MMKLLDRSPIDTYAPPSLEPLGSLHALTEGAGPNGEPVVMATGLFTPSGAASVGAGRVPSAGNAKS